MNCCYKVFVSREVAISLTGSQLRIRTYTCPALGFIDIKFIVQKHTFILSVNIDLKGYDGGGAALCGSGAEFYTHVIVTRKHLIKGTII
jgi:hypothetical protein